MNEDSQISFIGRIVGGRYQITECLAKGGMGIVFKGERLQLGRPVAIKFLLEPLSDSPEFLARFEREAKAMSQLSHPNCVSVIDFGVDENPYIVMDFVTGSTLRQILDQGLVDTGRAVHIAKQLLASLAHAHNQGIIHRDIKPENIMLSEATGMGDHVRIFDFGLAKLMDPEPGNNLSRTDLAMGTPSYMSPEQTLGNPADARSDIYSTGVVLFEMLTSRPPFIEENPFKVMQMHRDSAPATLNMAGSGKVFSREMELVVARALEKDPDKRFPSAMKFAEALVATPESKLAPIAFEIPSDSSAPATRSDMLPTVTLAITPDMPLRTMEEVPEPVEESSSAPIGDGPITGVAQIVDVHERRGSRLVALLFVLWALSALVLGFVLRDKLGGFFSSATSDGGIEPTSLEQEVAASVSNDESPSTIIIFEEQASTPQEERAEQASTAQEREEQASTPQERAEQASTAQEREEQASTPQDREEQASAPPGSDAGEPVEEEAELALQDLPTVTDEQDSSGEEESGRDADSELSKVRQFIDAKQYDEAIASLKELRRENPTKAIYPFMMAEVFFERRWLGASIDHYREAMRINPGFRGRRTLNENLISMLGVAQVNAKARETLIHGVGRPALPFLRRAAQQDESATVRKRAASIASVLSKTSSKTKTKSQSSAKSKRR